MSLEELPSPRWLLEQVRAPGVARAEVDALLRGLELPLEPGESARERADLLHEILEDQKVREYTGSFGREVGHVAVLQLVELGFPYALEVPPELFAQARAAGRGGASSGQVSRPRLGLGLIATAGGLEVLPGLFLALEGSSGVMAVALVWALVVSLTTFVPALLVDAEAVLSRRWLHYLLLVAIALPALPWLMATVMMVGFVAMNTSWVAAPFCLLPLGMAAMHLAGAKLLHVPVPSAKPPETEPG